MSNKGRSNESKRRRHAKAMAKRKAEKERRKAEYEAKIVIGTNSRRNKIAKRKGERRLVADYKNASPAWYVRVPPSKYGEVFWQ